MAVTKTHPIKSTLKAAIDYILNPEKTDGKLLASSFGCGLETADIEFAWTREAAGDRGTHLGRHLIQSFAVGETTPEEAHKIGMELAGAVLGGKYEFVLTTHVDKDHLHNHLIFNSVSFVDYKKYHSNKQSYYHIRRTSDRICKEHGLSVVVPGQDRGKSYAEYTAEKQGTSYKAKLKTAIDNLIPRVKDFDELLRRLQEMGYEIKQGKYISFRAAGQERFTRTKTLGAAYTEEAIKERIKGVYVAKTKTLREDKKIRLVVDLENSIKAQQSAGYERWAKIHNLKQAAKSMNFLTENKIEYYSELESKIADIMTAHDAAAKAVKEVEQRMSDLSLLIKHTTTYRQLKPIYDEYRKSPDKEKYLRGHESEIILFEAAARALKEMELNFIKCGDYYIPDIKLKNPNIRLGKWGRMRKEYLRLANPVLFSDMVLKETLYEHCAEIEETAKKRMEIIVPQLAKAYGVTEQLKAENQIEWVRQMNACVAQAEEAIKGELIYC